MTSYVGRKKWEAKLMANTIISAYAEATGRKSDAKSGFNDGTRPPGADALAAMGLAMSNNNGNYTH